jgi:hypothetical protein
MHTFHSPNLVDRLTVHKQDASNAISATLDMQNMQEFSVCTARSRDENGVTIRLSSSARSGQGGRLIVV